MWIGPDDYEIQLQNWRQWARQRDWLPIGYRCITGLLFLREKQQVESIDQDAPPKVVLKDALKFNDLVQSLDKKDFDFFIGHTLNKFVRHGRVKYASDQRQKQAFLGCSKATFYRTVNRAVEHLCRAGNLKNDK